MSVVRMRENGGWIDEGWAFVESVVADTRSEGRRDGETQSDVIEVPVPPPPEDQFHSEEETVQSSSRACKRPDEGEEMTEEFRRRFGRRTEERMKGTSVVRTSKERWERVSLGTMEITHEDELQTYKKRKEAGDETMLASTKDSPDKAYTAPELDTALPNVGFTLPLLVGVEEVSGEDLERNEGVETTRGEV